MFVTSRAHALLDSPSSSTAAQTPSPTQMVWPHPARPLIARLTIQPARRTLCTCAAQQAKPWSCHARLPASSPRRRFSSEQSPLNRLRRARPLVRHAVAQRFVSAGSSRASRTVVVVAMLAAVAVYVCNSETVPVTGRRRFNFLSDKYVEYAYVRAADEVVEMVRDEGGHFLSDGDPRTVMVRRVMRNLIRVSGLSELDWEVRVIADNQTANAFVLPGGKVFVHSGLLLLCRNEDALAAVLGHEIAHNTASHMAERLSSAWTLNFTAGSLFFLAGALPGAIFFALWTYVGGFYITDLLYHLPMGRHQEFEADYIGLMMMAEACYDPRQAVGFWERMAVVQKLGGDEVEPEVLSTHPSNKHRIAKMKEWVPLAMEKRAQSDCRSTSAFADRFRIALRRRVPLKEVEGM
ncbi:hypothetical protein E4U42_003708 [Claviceps africana]|uniref:Peptidase M48 domain-containing protein n=1 Tax=Claviceps africana TaxID=83212 RepID=A0A8K0NIM8_9HYPO|nr:hypothetical protein E4U42_003708 [Claviceps africana]